MNNCISCSCCCNKITVRDLKWQWFKMHADLTHHLFNIGQITEKEYKKYLLDE